MNTCTKTMIRMQRTAMAMLLILTVSGLHLLGCESPCSVDDNNSSSGLGGSFVKIGSYKESSPATMKKDLMLKVPFTSLLDNNSSSSATPTTPNEKQGISEQLPDITEQLKKLNIQRKEQHNPSSTPACENKGISTHLEESLETTIMRVLTSNKLIGLPEEVENLKGELAQAKQSIVTLETTIGRLKQRNEDLEKEKKELDQQRCKDQATIDGWKIQCENVNAEKQRLEEQLHALLPKDKATLLYPLPVIVGSVVVVGGFLYKFLHSFKNK